MTKLNEQTRALYEEYQKVVPKEVMTVIDSATEELVGSGIAERCLTKGDKAVDFTLPDSYGKDVSLTSILEKGPVVLSFYRGGWCTFCNLELKALQDRLDDIKEVGGQLVAVTPQNPDGTRDTLEELGIEYPILTDKHNLIAEKYGLVFDVAESLKPIYEEVFNLDIPSENMDDSYRLPVTATYVIGQDGTIVSANTGADFTYRQEPDEIIAIIKSQTLEPAL